MVDVTSRSTSHNDTATARSTQDRLKDVGLGVTRVVIAFLFVLHGTQGLFGWFGGIDGQGAAAPFGVWPFWYASALETVGGVLVLLGLLTRPAALLCSGVMAYAYFTVHQPMALLPMQNMGEESALYSWIFLLIGILGPGAFALDSLFRRGRKAA